MGYWELWVLKAELGRNQESAFAARSAIRAKSSGKWVFVRECLCLTFGRRGQKRQAWRLM